MFAIGNTTVPDDYVLDMGRISVLAQAAYEKLYPPTIDGSGNIIFSGSEPGTTAQMYYKSMMAYVQTVMMAADKHRLSLYYNGY